MKGDFQLEFAFWGCFMDSSELRFRFRQILTNLLLEFSETLDGESREIPDEDLQELIDAWTEVLVSEVLSFAPFSKK